MDKKISVISDLDGKKIVVISDILLKERGISIGKKLSSI